MSNIQRFKRDLKQYRGIEPLPSDWKSKALTVTPVLHSSTNNNLKKKN